MGTSKGPYTGLKNILKKLSEKNEEIKVECNDSVIKQEIRENLQDTNKTKSHISDFPFFGDFLSDGFILDHLYVIEEDSETTNEKWKEYMEEYPNIMDGNTEERNTVAEHLGGFFVKKYNSESLSEREIKLVKEFLQRVSNKILPPAARKSFRDTILNSNLTYGIVDHLYEITKANPSILSDGELRSTFKDEDSAFRFESMLAYLQKNEAMIEKIEYIVSIALKVKHTDGTNSSSFIESAEDIVQNAIAKSYAPTELTQRTTKNKNKVQNRISEDLERASDEFFDMLK